jgi:hypothetical protein
VLVNLVSLRFWRKLPVVPHHWFSSGPPPLSTMLPLSAVSWDGSVRHLALPWAGLSWTSTQIVTNRTTILGS